MGLFGGGDKGFDAARRALDSNRQLYDAIDLPEYDEMVPELYNTESANYELTNEDPVVRSMQLQALAKMGDLSETGLSEMDQAGFARARSMGDQVARSKTDAAIGDAQVRGVAGGGQEFAMREQASQAAAQRAQEAALAQAQASAQQRQMALSAYANQVSGARDQNYRAGAANTDIINRFNQANTSARNATGAANVGQKNEAWQYNQGLKDKNYNNQLGMADRKSGFNDRGAEISSAEEEAKKRRNQATGSLVGGLAGSYFGPMGAGVGSQIGGSLA